MALRPLNISAAPSGGVYYGGSGGGGGHSFLHYLVHNPVTHIADQTVEGLANDAINAIPGLWTAGGMAIHHPEDFAKAFGKGLYEPFVHPLRHPDQTLLSLLALAPIPGAGISRVADIASIVGREGALPAELADTAKIAESGLSPLHYAESIGQGDRYGRAVGAEGVPKSVGSQVFSTLLHGTPDEERLLKTPTGETRKGWQYSKDPTIKAMQKMIDGVYNHYEGDIPGALRVVPGFQRTQAGRLNAAAKAAQVIERNSAAKNGAAFLKKWAGKLDTEQEHAVRMVGEMTTPEKLANLHEAELATNLGKGANDVNLAETEARITLTQGAAKYVEPKQITLESGRQVWVPVLREDAPKAMHEYLADARKLSNEQQTAVHETGILSTESELNRLMAPFHQVTFGGKTPPSIEKLTRRLNQLRNLKGTEAERTKVSAQIDDLKKQWEPKDEPILEGEAGAAARQAEIDGHVERIKGNHPVGDNLEEVPHDMTVAEMQELRAKADPFYIPYRIHEKDKKGFGFTAFRKAFKFTNRPTVPSRFTHAVGGTDERTLLKQGGGRTDVTQMLYENHLEGVRYVALAKNYRSLVATAQDTPEGIPEGHARLIRDFTTLKGGTMPYEKAEEYGQVAQDLTEGKAGVLPGDERAHGVLFEGIRNWIFPELRKFFSPDEIKEGKFRPVPGYKWVDDRTVGFLDKQNPLWSAFSNSKVRGIVKTADTINRIQKSMILYLKPAYAFPNAFGNLFLNMVQQGMFAPINLARSFKIFSRLDPETIVKIRKVMGSGFSEQLKPTDIAGHVHRITNAFSSGYGKVVDDPFRFSSFLHEARRSGFKTNADIKRLFDDPNLADTVERISNRANEEILNYDRMGPGEEAVLRRLVFFYPWLKASTRYASYIAKNHPIITGSTSPLGQMGEARIKRVLGDLPSFEEGLIPYTTAHGAPWSRTALTGNPASFAILQQPADLAKTLLNVIHGHPNLDLNAAGNLAPVDRALLALLTAGKMSTLPHSVNEPVLQTAWNEITGGNPLIGGPSSLIERMTGGKTYPGSIFPYNDKWTPLLKFFATGALTPTLTNVPELNWKAYQQANTTGFTGG